MSFLTILTPSLSFHTPAIHWGLFQSPHFQFFLFLSTKWILSLSRTFLVLCLCVYLLLCHGLPGIVTLLGTGLSGSLPQPLGFELPDSGTFVLDAFISHPVLKCLTE